MASRPMKQRFYPIEWAQISRRMQFWRASGARRGCGRPHQQTVGSLTTAALFLLIAAVSLASAATNAAADSASPTPLPGRTIISEVHNAPGWLPVHSYTSATAPYTRVVNGPGWVPAAGSYKPGQLLNAYQLISAGTCVSGPTGPAGIGSSIRDGSCIWRYLSRVDYITLSGWSYDAVAWKQGQYSFRDYVTSDTPLRSYTIESKGVCASTVPPTGTGSNSNRVFKTSDGCEWRYVGDVIYTSRRSYIPTEKLPPSGNGPGTYTMDANHQADLWNDREYLAGSNGESAVIRLAGHYDLSDGFSWREGNWRIKPDNPYHIIITAAPGESFVDHLRPSDPLRGYDPSKGVAIRNPDGAGIEIRDAFVDIIGLQFKGTNDNAIMRDWGWAGSLVQCIVEGGSPAPGYKTLTLWGGTQTAIANSLIINHGRLAIMSKYPFSIHHSTVVNPDHVPDSIGIQSIWKWYFKGITIENTAIFGFSHATAHIDQAHLGVNQPAEFWTADSTHNATDASGSDGGNLHSPLPPSQLLDADPMPGALYSLRMSDVFVAPGRDWRLKPGSPLIGAGFAFCSAQMSACGYKVARDYDTPDIIGTPRAQGGGCDIGAWQSPAGWNH